MPLADIRARTAARKAAGENQAYPVHAGPVNYDRIDQLLPPGPCAHLGRELTGPERTARGLGHVRKWSLCLHPDQPLGETVCPCKGCGPKCAGYSPE